VLDGAMNWARHINKGRMTLAVEGDDGTCRTKQQIATVLKHSESESDRDNTV
jgi:hypothetical protein